MSGHSWSRVWLVVVLAAVFTSHGVTGASLITNATCAFSPTVVSGLLLSGAALNLVNMVPSGLCGRVALKDVVSLKVSAIDTSLASYTVAGTVTFTMTQYLTTSLVATDLSYYRTTQLYWVNTQSATTTTFAATTTVAPATSTTSRVSTPTPTTTVAPVTVAATTTTTTNYASGPSAVFSSATSFDTPGLWRTTIRATAQVLALPDLAPFVIDVAAPITCDAVTPTIPAFTLWPPNGTAFNSGDVISARAIPNDVNTIALFAKNTTTCSLYVTTGSKVASAVATLVALDAYGQYSVPFSVSSAFGGWVTVTVSGLCDFGATNPYVYALLGNQSTLVVPATNYLYYFRAAAPTPRIIVQASPEKNQAAVGNDQPSYIFNPVTVSFSSDAGQNQTTFVIIIPGNVMPASLPSVNLFTAYVNLASPFPASGIQVTQTSWVLAYTTAPLSVTSAVAAQLITIQTGTETWKYVLVGVIVVGAWLVFVGFVLRDAIKSRLSIKRRRAAREEARNRVPLQVVIFGDKEDEWRVEDSPEMPTNAKEARRWRRRRKAAQRRAAAEQRALDDEDDRSAWAEVRSKFLRVVCFLGFVANDVVLVGLNIAFAVTSLGYNSVDVSYKILWTVTMLFFAGSTLGRWLWASNRFDPPSEDDVVEDEADRDDKEVSLSLQFAPLVNIVLCPYFAKRHYTIVNTERSRSFWGGVTRLFVDFPQLVMCGTYIGQYPTHTTDASLLQFYFSLACVLFGLESLVNAVMVLLYQCYRFCWLEGREKGSRDASDNEDEDAKDGDDGDAAPRDVDEPHKHEPTAAGGRDVPHTSNDPHEEVAVSKRGGAGGSVSSVAITPTPSTPALVASTDPFLQRNEALPPPVMVTHSRRPSLQNQQQQQQAQQLPLTPRLAPVPPPGAAVSEQPRAELGDAEKQVLSDLETLMRLRVLRELGFAEQPRDASEAPPTPKSVRFDTGGAFPPIPTDTAASSWQSNRQPSLAGDDEETSHTVDFHQQAAESRGPSVDGTAELDFDI